MEGGPRSASKIWAWVASAAGVDRREGYGCAGVFSTGGYGRWSGLCVDFQCYPRP